MLRAVIILAATMLVAACGGQNPTDTPDPIQDPNNRCDGVACSQDSSCDMNTGACVASMPVDPCESCTSSEVCDDGACAPKPTDPCAPFMWANDWQVDCHLLSDPVRTFTPTERGEQCIGVLAPKTSLAGVLTNDPNEMPTADQPIVTYPDPEDGPTIHYLDPDNGMVYAVDCDWKL